MSDTILVFIDWYLPGYKAGGPVTSCANMIEDLRDDFNFKVVTRNNDYCETEPYQSIEPNVWIDRAENESVLYLSPDRVSFAEMRKIIEENPDAIIYVNGIYSLYFSIAPVWVNYRLGKCARRMIIASRGMLSRSAIGVKSFQKILFLRLAKWIGLYHRTAFHATNPKERDDVLREIGKSTRVFVASNLVTKRSELSPAPDKDRGQLKLISMARIAPEKNLLFILKALQNVEVEVTLSVYGAVYNKEYWQECQQAISGLPVNIIVEHLDWIAPSKVQQTISDHHVLVLPSLGENYGHVIAESFLSGRPVLISDQTPWRELAAQYAGADLPLNQPEKFVRQIEFWAAMDTQEFSLWCSGAAEKGKAIASDVEPRENHLKMFQNV